MPRFIMALAVLIGLAGVSHGDMRTAQHDTRASEQQLETVIKTYGKRAIIRFILTQTSGRITLRVGKELRTFYGVPDPVYVTPRTIRMDLRALGVTVSELEQRLHQARPQDRSERSPLETHPLAQHARPRDRRAPRVPKAQPCEGSRPS